MGVIRALLSGYIYKIIRRYSSTLFLFCIINFVLCEIAPWALSYTVCLFGCTRVSQMKNRGQQFGKRNVLFFLVFWFIAVHVLNTRT